jgi:hypothetical protein
MSSDPRCPRCGEPARVVVVVKARVRCGLNVDGSPGVVLSVSRREALEIEGYECGGGHHWRLPANKDRIGKRVDEMTLSEDMRDALKWLMGERRDRGPKTVTFQALQRRGLVAHQVTSRWELTRKGAKLLVSWGAMHPDDMPFHPEAASA